MADLLAAVAAVAAAAAVEQLMKIRLLVAAVETKVEMVETAYQLGAQEKAAAVEVLLAAVAVLAETRLVAAVAALI